MQDYIVPHVALLASPGMGHLIPVVELGKRLAVHHGFDVTVFVVATDISPAESLLLKPPPPSGIFDIISLPPTDLSGVLDPDASIVPRLAAMVRESLPDLKAEISKMKRRPTTLIVDLFGTEAFAVAEEFRMLKYVFIASNAWFLALTLYIPTIDEKSGDDHVILQNPLDIPGCDPVRYEDTLEALKYRDIDLQMQVEYSRIGVEITMADGVLVNTWDDLEPKSIASLGNNKCMGRVTKIPVYPVGPVVRTVGLPDQKTELLDWLSGQPEESVIYVSFGSGGTLPAEQITELAWGLELSEQRFIWVIRPPIEHDVMGSYLTVAKGDVAEDPDFFPVGFCTRIQEKGILVPMWAPQAEILSHPSVGGFLSHCGWNSTLESITNGVPMISWPLYAEQKMNATMLTEVIGVSVRVKAGPNGVVGREEIAKMVRMVTEKEDGNLMRKRVKEVKNSAEKALCKNGSSNNSLCQVAQDCKIRMECLKAKARGG